jgi:hypothetical protein
VWGAKYIVCASVLMLVVWVTVSIILYLTVCLYAMLGVWVVCEVWVADPVYRVSTQQAEGDLSKLLCQAY